MNPNRKTAAQGLLRCIGVTLFLLAIFAVPVFSQDDDEVELVGKVLDSANKQIGKAELIQHSGSDVKIMFGYYLKMWLDGGNRLRIIKPQSGTRSTTIGCSFRDYKVDAKNPKDSTKWDETGSGTATLQMPGTGDVHKIAVSMTLTMKVTGNDEVAVTEKPQKVTISLD